MIQSKNKKQKILFVFSYILNVLFLIMPLLYVLIQLEYLYEMDVDVILGFFVVCFVLVIPTLTTLTFRLFLSLFDKSTKIAAELMIKKHDRTHSYLDYFSIPASFIFSFWTITMIPLKLSTPVFIAIILSVGIPFHFLFKGLYKFIIRKIS